MSAPQGHSRRGASGAYRWMPCPGSVELSEGIEDEESEHAAIGTAAHALAEHCLHYGNDAWEYIGATDLTEGPAIDASMSVAVQQYLDKIRTLHPDRNQGNFFVERRFHCPTIHPEFYGTSDAVYVDMPARTLDIHDYKNGVLLVEVKNNPQGMYYACGMLTELGLWDEIDVVSIHIHQPNGFHHDGPHRTWQVSVGTLGLWLHETLLPAMNSTSRDTRSGEHCRFCPARLNACPQLMNDMEEYEAMLKSETAAPQLTGAQLARLLELDDLRAIVIKAAKKTAFGRISSGHVVPGWGLTNAKSNRVYKEGAEAAAVAKFGKAAAYSKPELLSPAQIEALPEGKAFAAQWAFKPDAGLTLVRDSDARPKVSKDTKSLFKPIPKRVAK